MDLFTVDSHDRDALFHQGFDGGFTAADMRVVRSGVRVPRVKQAA
jgi:hypothetical protein